MRKDDSLVSVVVPVYNAEKYFERCMESVCGQMYRNLQIVLVDDGSEDASGKMCDEWAGRDKRVTVLHKKNEGLGMARNSGMEIAEGKYLFFMDADDYIKKSTIQELLELAESRNADICYGGMIDVAADGTEYQRIAPAKQEYCGKEIITEFIADALAMPPESSENSFAGMSACGVLYHTGFLKAEGIYFQREQKVLCEDLFFNIAAGKKAKRVVLASDCYYFYCLNAGSLSRKYRPDRYEAAKNMKKLLEYELQLYMKNSCIKERIDRNYLDNLIMDMRLEILFRKENGWKHCKRRLREMAADETTREVLASYPLERLGQKQRLLFTMILHTNITAIYWLFRIRYRM